MEFDWSNDRVDWEGPLDDQQRLVEQCRLVKAYNPQIKCFVYRNTELALEWFSTQKDVMDEQHAGWFVNFEDDTVPRNPWLTADQKCAAAGPCTYSTNGGPPNRPPYHYGTLWLPASVAASAAVATCAFAVVIASVAVVQSASGTAPCSVAATARKARGEMWVRRRRLLLSFQECVL